jgi:WD40 repeat protein
MRRWFLSYNSQDAALANSFKAALQQKDPASRIFFAEESLRAGGYWLPELAQEIAEASVFILLVGEKGLGSWQVMEYYEALDRRVKDHAFPVILVLLDGQPAPGLPFLRQLHWIVTDAPASEKSAGLVMDAAAGGGAPPGELWRHTAPYRGLHAMTEADSDFFLGRGEKTAEVIKSLETKPDKLPVLLGNSGVGKSSLAQAGILAAITRQGWPEADGSSEPWPAAFSDSRRWCVLRLRPGSEPIRELVKPFLQTWKFEATDPARAKVQAGWVDDLRGGAVSLRDLLDATELRYHDELHQEKPPAFLIYIDQGEELYVRVKDEHERRRFSEILAEGLADPRLRALMSLRADFYGALQNDEPLYDAHHAINVPPLREAELHEVVSRPAQLLSASFETETLAADITQQAAEESVKDAGALPLLSYLLDDMWSQMIRRGDGILRLPATAIELGGVLVRRADEFLAARPNSEDVLRRVLTLKLATVREEGEPTRRRAPRSEFSDEEWQLVSELADHPHRLLITATAEGLAYDGEVYAEVAHEAIFRRWGKLKGWIAAEREFLIWKSALEADRRRWELTAAKSQDDALLMGLALAQAQDWLGRRGSDLPPSHREFIRLSSEHEERRRKQERRLRRRVRIWQVGAALAVPVTLIIIGLIGYGGWTLVADTLKDVPEKVRQLVELKIKYEDTLKAESASWTAFARDALARQDPQQAEILALRGLPGDGQAKERPIADQSVAILRQALGQDRERAILPDHIWSGGAVKAAAVSPDGKWIATASDDRTARIFDARTGAALAVLRGHAGSVSSVAFSPDGKQVLTAAEDGARLWDAASGALIAQLPGSGGKVRSALFSPDGRSAATAAQDGARIWDLQATPPAPRVLVAHAVSFVRYSSDGKLLAALDDFTARIFGPSGVAIGVVAHNEAINAAAFSPDGLRIVTASNDGTARIWNISGGDPQQILKGNGGKVFDASFSTDGSEVVTASDGAAWLWNASTGALVSRLEGRQGNVAVTRFSLDPGSQWIVTASDDKTARLWDRRTGQQVVLRGHGAKVNAAVFDPDGQYLLTASDDGTARVWDARPAGAMPILDPSALPVPDQIMFGLAAAIEDPHALNPGQALLNTGNAGGTRTSAKGIEMAGADPCGQLDPDPEDPRDAAPNATDDLPPSSDAVVACQTVALRGNDALHRYELGRGLEKTGAPDKAMAQYVALAQQGYGPADFRLALITWSRNGPGDRREAVESLRQGADAGDPYCQRRLAELYERGEEVDADLRQALIHHLIAARLFARDGADADAEIARYRTASLARIMPPQEAVAAAREAMTWLSDRAKTRR